MIVKPKIRGFICTTAHPAGCAQHVQQQIDYVLEHGPIKDGPRKVLVLGASTGYGLASRIVAAFGCRAETVGVFFEKEAEGKRTATAGYYNSVAVEEKTLAEGLYTKSVNGDAFSDEVKQQVVDILKRDVGPVDLIIYSVAAPRRVHPRTGKISKSVLKPVGQGYTNKSIDMQNATLEEVSLPPATEEEIEQTVAVMGGEDWRYWIDILEENNLLADGVTTVAYSYIGPEVTQGVYRNGTIGQAKDHLERTANELDARLKKRNGRALISVNKALVTQSSSAIPFIPLYFVILSKVMKEKGLEEDTIMQIDRLFRDFLYGGAAPATDESGFIRLDDRELRADVQTIVNERWAQLTQDTLKDLADLEGYQSDFLRLFGFGLPGVDYDADVDVGRTLPSLKESPAS